MQRKPTYNELVAENGRLRADLERSRQLTETVKDAMITINDIGRITYLNPAAERLFGYSRDDGGVFLPEYVEKGILERDPFQSLDQQGVGQLVEMGVTKGRSTRRDLKVGICGEHGGDPSSIDFCFRVGMFGAEPWSDEARLRIENALGLRAHDVYGMSELYGPGLAVDCVHQNGLHVWSDEFLVEVIDPDTGEVLPEGSHGELVFTMLTREAMPLLRYRTRDLSSVTYEECECGRHHPRILRVKGRSDDMLIIGGVNVFPSQVETVLMKMDGVGDQYQIIVDRDILDKLHLKVEVDEKFFKSPNYDPATFTKELGDELTAIMTIRVRIELMEPGSLPRTEGKAKRVIDLRKG